MKINLLICTYNSKVKWQKELQIHGGGTT